MTKSIRLWTDFNYMEDEDRVWADLDKAEWYFEEGLRVGQRAELFDGLGYECMGTIMTVDSANRMVELAPDWTTWHSTRRKNLDYSDKSHLEFAGHGLQRTGTA
jgi:hypothetical protein